MAASRRGTAAVLIAWSLLAVGDSAHAGYFSNFGLACIVAGFIVLVVVVAARLPVVVPDRAVLVVPMLVCVGVALLDPSRRFLYITGRDLHVICALTAVTAGVAALSLLSDGERWQRWIWRAVLVLAGATGITTIVLISNPGIDVWELLQQSSTGLLHGDDMYRQHWLHSTGLQSVYPYLPGTTLLLAPFRWLFGDVRFGLLAASLGGAWLVRKYGSAAAPPALAALLIVLPDWAYLVNRSWTEPLLVAALAAAIMALRSGRTGLAVVAFAVALACKQHIILLVPLFALWPTFGLRRTITAAGLALLAVLPWFIAGPHDMWHDAVHANLGLAAEPMALNLQAFLLRHGVGVGSWFLVLGLVATYALVLLRMPRSPSGLALGCAVVMWAFDLANTQTFFNHYVLPLGLLVIALAASEVRSGDQLPASLRSGRPSDSASGRRARFAR